MGFGVLGLKAELKPAMLPPNWAQVPQARELVISMIFQRRKWRLPHGASDPQGYQKTEVAILGRYRQNGRSTFRTTKASVSR